MSEAIGCCGSWDKCAAELRCVNKRFEKDCHYNYHLKDGFNFHCPIYKKGPYLELNKRQYYIGTAGKNGSRRLTEEQSETLRQYGLAILPFSLKDARIENPEDTDPCNFKVRLEADGMDLVLYNANIRALKRSTAALVVEALTGLGLKAWIETVGPDQRPSYSTPRPVKAAVSAPVKVAVVPAEIHENTVAVQEEPVQERDDPPGSPQPEPPASGSQPVTASASAKKKDAAPLQGQVSLFDL